MEDSKKIGWNFAVLGLLCYWGLFLFCFFILKTSGVGVWDAGEVEKMFGQPWADFLSSQFKFVEFPYGLFLFPVLLNGLVLFFVTAWFFTRSSKSALRIVLLPFLGICIPLLTTLGAAIILENTRFGRLASEESKLFLAFGLAVDVATVALLRYEGMVKVIVFVMGAVWLLLGWILSYLFIFGAPHW